MSEGGRTRCRVDFVCVVEAGSGEGQGDVQGEDDAEDEGDAVVGGGGGGLVGIKKLLLPQAGSNCALGKHVLDGENTFSGMLGRGFSIGSTEPLCLLPTLDGCV